MQLHTAVFKFEVIHIQCCTKYPTLGGKHKSANRYCDEHAHMEECDTGSIPYDDHLLLSLNSLMGKQFVG